MLHANLLAQHAGVYSQQCTHAAVAMDHFAYVQGVEATLFATLMSILNGGGFTGAAFGSLLTGWFGVTADNFDNLFWLVLLCTLSSLAPLPLLRLVPGGNSEDDRSAAQKDSE